MDIDITEFGEALYERMRARVAEAKSVDPLRMVTLVVPSQQIGVTARRFLAAGVTPGRPGIAALTVVTIRRLAEQLAGGALAAAGRRPLTDPVLAAAVRRALDEAPGVFVAVAQHRGTTTALANAYRSLRRLQPPQWTVISASLPLTAEVVRLVGTVREATEPEWFDDIDLLDAAADRIRSGATDIDRYGPVVVVLPDERDPAALDVLAALEEVGVGLSIVLATTGDATADRHTREFATRLGASAWPHIPAPHADTILSATDADDEVRAAVHAARAQLARSPGHRVAILYGSPDPYARLLAEHTAAAELTTYGRGVRPVLERQFGRAILRLLALPASDFDRAKLMAWLTDAPVRYQGHPVRSSRWERLAREAAVLSGESWQRLRNLAVAQRELADAEERTATPRQWRVHKFRSQAEDADTLADFVDNLRDRLGAIEAAETWAAAASSLEELWTDLIRVPGQLPDPGELRAAERVSSALQALAGLDGVAGSPSVEAIREVVELQLSDDLGRVGTIGTGIHIGPITDAPGIDVDRVIVVGMAEGLLPRHITEDPLLPDSARSSTDGVLPTTAESLTRQHRLLLAAMAGARASTLTFPRGDLRRGGERVPSRWLMPSLRTLVGDDTVQATEWQRTRSPHVVVRASHAAATETGVPATAQGWRQQAALTGGLADPTVDAAVAMRRARTSTDFTRYDGNLTDVSDLPDPTGGTAISPSALEQWVRCPHGYLMRYILGVEPVADPDETLDMTAAERGTLVHGILEEFIQVHGHRPPEQPWDDNDRSALIDIAERHCADAEAKGLTGADLLWQRTKREVLADLLAVLDADTERRCLHGLTAVAVELPFGIRGTPPVEIALDGRILRLRGMADRVDRAADGSLVVIDYKAGSPSSFDDLSSEDPTLGGTKLQLPLYALAARAAHGEPHTPVRAEYWFTSRAHGCRRVGYQVDADVLDCTHNVLATIAVGIRRGLFPARPTPDRREYLCQSCNVDTQANAEIARRWERIRDDPLLADYVALVEPGDAS